MQRDMELIRELLESMASDLSYNGGIVIFEPKVGDKWTMDDYNHHVELCGKAGILEVERIDKSTPFGARIGAGNGDFLITRLTWVGYDLLDELREKNGYTPARNPIGFAVQQRDEPDKTRIDP